MRQQPWPLPSRDVIGARRQRIRERLLRETRETSSWIYGDAWRTREVVALTLALLAGLWLAAVLPLALSHPASPLNPGWNTIDHIEDRRWPLWDYARGGVRAMAAADGWLAVATNADGLVLINADSRVPRRAPLVGGVLDVSPGPGAASFVALNATQELSLVEARLTAPWHRRAPLMPAPSQPHWRGAKVPAADDVLAMALDARGWLLVTRSAGVARYVFSPGAAGTVERRRSWQLAPSTLGTPLTRALVTEQGIWVAASRVMEFLAADSLQPDPARRLAVADIARFDADAGGRWASAATAPNAGGRTWLLPPGAQSWSGPWFGRSSVGRALSSAADVTVARLDGAVAWLGTAYGLYAADLDRHSMHVVVPDLQVRDIEVVSGGAAGTSTALMATSGGVYRIVSTPGAERTFTATRIDTNPASDLALSADGGLAVYRVSASAPMQDMVRALTRPFAGPPITVAGGEPAWRSVPAAPVVTGIAQVGDRSLFATSAGCFAYQPATARYDDCSPPAAPTTGGGMAFTAISATGQEVAVVAGGAPFSLESGTSLRWRPLDSGRTTAPMGIAAAGGRVAGYGASGELYVYPAGGAPLPRGQHRVAGLDGQIAPVIGDIQRLTGGREWQVAFLFGGRLVQYQTTSGALGEVPLPRTVRLEDVIQVRFVGGTPCYVLADGRIVRPDGTVLFGGGGLSFAPEDVTSLAPGRQPQSVVLGGPSGQMARYAWDRGTWEAVPPLSGGADSGAVAEVQDTEQGLWARLAGGQVALLRGNAWARSTAWKQWAAAGAEAWLVGPGGIQRVTPDESAARVLSGPPTHSRGAGMREFVAGAAFAWQPSPDRVLVVRWDGRVGVYDVQTDSWTADASPFFRQPTQFARLADALVALDGRQVVRLTADLRPHVLYTLPSGARAAVIAGDEEPGEPAHALRLLYLDDDGVVQVEWEAGAEAPTRTTRTPGDAVEGERDVASRRVVATVPVNDARLEWAVGGGGLEVVWRGVPGGSSPPVWGTCGGLATQCVIDIAFGQGTTLMLATEAGLLTRNRENYGVVSYDPRDRRTDLGSVRRSLEVRTGPWRWQVTAQGVAISQSDGGRPRPWADSGATSSGLRFKDDTARWIGAAAAALYTDDGEWDYSAAGGRSGTGRFGAVRVPEWGTVGDAAIQITYDDGRLSFSAFDAGQPFSEGRFYFDATHGVGGLADGAIYTLVPGRAVVRRVGSTLGEITGAWSLPAPALGAGGGRLLARGNVLLLEDGPSVRWYELEVGRTEGQWREASTPYAEATAGRISWQRSPGAPALRPYLVADGAAPVPLDAWWDRDRFAWDRVSAAGALDQSTVALVTPLGVFARAAAGRLAPGEAWLMAGLERAEMARSEEGRALGLLVSGAGTVPGPRYLLERTGTTPTALTGTASALEGRRARAIVEYVDVPPVGRHVGLREHWQPSASTAAVLDSRLPALPVQGLIVNGAFAFAQTAGAAPLPEKRWLVPFGCPSTAGVPCLAGIFESVGDQMVLREVFSGPGRVEAIRTAADGAVVALLEDAPETAGVPASRIVRASIVNGAVSWTAAGDVTDPFRNGDSVVVDAATLSWSSSPRYAWQGPATVETVPAGYPLFHTAPGGVALSFDVLTSAAYDRRGKSLALGTAAGILLCEEGQYERPLVGAFSGGRAEFGCAPGEPSTQLGSVSRVRFDAEGGLWAETGGEHRWRRRLADGRWEPVSDVPFHRLEAGGREARITPEGLRLGTRLFQASNDAWFLGQRSFGEIVDVAVDERRGVLWLAGRESGVFKVLLNHLP